MKNPLGNPKGVADDGMMTPRYLFDQLDRIFQFTLDAACTSINCLAPQGFHFDKGEDAFKYEWTDHRVFCNPPFSEKARWMKKAHEEVQHNGCLVVVMVLPTNSMDSEPWFKYVYPHYHYHHMQARVSFIDPKTGKPKSGNNSGTTIIYFMKRPRRMT